MGTPALGLTVTSKAVIADGVVDIVLAGEAGRRLPDWTPGAHLVLDLPVGPRCYSLCGDRWNAFTYRLAVHRDDSGAGGSVFVHDVLEVGQRVLASPPVNNFPLIPSADYLFIAGGIGITPILPMIDQALRLEARWQLAYGARTRAAMAFVDELIALPGRVDIWPEDERGRIDLARLIAGIDATTAVYACGPPQMLAAVRRELGPSTWRLRTEAFSRSGARLRPATAFDVVVGTTGQRLSVPADRTLYDVLATAGIPVQGACLQGVCGSCETGLLRGVVETEDSPRDGAGHRAASSIFPCVSRARSGELVLDL